MRGLVEGEITKIGTNLQKEIDNIIQEQTARIVAAVNHAEQTMAPLRAYLYALDMKGAPEQVPSTGSAMARLGEALLRAESGLHRRDLDHYITAAGLSIASARKARHLAEMDGIATRRGAVWSLTPEGRAAYLRRSG